MSNSPSKPANGAGFVAALKKAKSLPKTKTDVKKAKAEEQATLLESHISDATEAALAVQLTEDALLKRARDLGAAAVKDMFTSRDFAVAISVYVSQEFSTVTSMKWYDMTAPRFANLAKQKLSNEERATRTAEAEVFAVVEKLREAYFEAARSKKVMRRKRIEDASIRQSWTRIVRYAREADEVQGVVAKRETRDPKSDFEKLEGFFISAYKFGIKIPNQSQAEAQLTVLAGQALLEVCGWSKKQLSDLNTSKGSKA